MRLFLARHAQVAPDSPLKQLSPLGITQAGELAEWLSSETSSATAVLHSPAVRAAETAAIIARKLELIDRLQPLESLGIDEPPSPFAAKLTRYDDDVVAVSHQPFVNALSALLLGREKGIDLPAAGCVVLTRNDDGWSVHGTFAPTS